MAAGISCFHDKFGGQTADLIHCEPRARQFATSSSHHGTGVLCHADQTYNPPGKPAGQSKRMGAFYNMTGSCEHRSEPGFRDTKAGGLLTEVPIQNYGTLRRSAPLPGATSTLHSAGSLALGAPAKREDDVGSYRSRSSAASSRRSDARSGRGVLPAAAAPSWRQNVQTPASQPWNFETLPMYERSSEGYGKGHQAASRGGMPAAAGKSESGFIDPAELVQKLTRPHHV